MNLERVKYTDKITKIKKSLIPFFTFQLIPTLEWCLVDNFPNKPLLFNQTSQLIRYWSKNRNVTDYKSYSHLVQKFWTHLETKLLELINSAQENFDPVYIANLDDSVLDFLLSLKNTSVINRKSLRVKFFDPNKQVETSEEISPKVVDADSIYLAELEELINKVISIHFANIQKDSSRSALLKNFYKLVSNFESKNLFVTLVKSYSKETSLFDFYDKVLKNWLIEKSEHTELVIMLLFILMKYLDVSEMNAILASLIQVND